MLFRANFVTGMIIQFGWICAYLLLIHILFLHTNNIVGWSKRDMFLLGGIWLAVSDLLEATVATALLKIPEYVRYGTLDHILTRPVDSQFIISFWRFDFMRSLMLLADLGIIAYALSIESVSLNLTMVVAPLLIINGAVIGYAMSIALQSLAFWFVKVDNLWALFNGILDVAKYPLDIFGKVVKLITLTAVPLALMIMLPAQALLGRASWLLIGYSFCVSAVFLFLSRRFYQFAVRRYSSVA